MAFDPSERDLIDSLGIGTPGSPYADVNDFSQQYQAYYDANIDEMIRRRNEAQARNKGNSFLGKVFQTAVPAALPFLGPALGLGALASAGLGAATGAGYAAASGANPLVGGLTGGIGGGLASLGAAGARPDTLLPQYMGGSSLPAALPGSVNASASGFGAYQDRPDYEPDRPVPDEPPLLDVIIGVPPAPPIYIPPPRLPEEGDPGGGGAPAPSPAPEAETPEATPTTSPSPGSGSGSGSGSQDEGGTGGTTNPPILDDPYYDYVGRDEDGNDVYVGRNGEVERVPNQGGATGEVLLPQEPGEETGEGVTDVVLSPEAEPVSEPTGGTAVPSVPSPTEQVGDAQGAGEGGFGNGEGLGDGAGSGDGSGDGDGDGDGSGDGLDIGSMEGLLGMLGMLGMSPGAVTAETPEGADIKLYDLENLFGVSGLDSVYNAPFEDELTLITEELLRAARGRR